LDAPGHEQKKPFFEPDPEEVARGLVAVGGELTPETLVSAYQNGIFPWPSGEDEPLLWFSPDPRAILEFDRLHIPRSLAKARKQTPLTFTCDAAFDLVIDQCSELPRADQDGTWITAEMLAAYREFHRLGYAHSFEAWEGSRLVGGLYGVAVDGVFAGESMFHLQPNASKLTLLYAIERLREWGAEWIDIQMLTPHFEALGARTIARERFLALLRTTQARKLRFFRAA
jgi:leucyl/phenylalanyl-tRNA--protein transferase